MVGASTGGDDLARVARLPEAEETLRAIRNGEVDALLIEGPRGTRVYTLQEAEVPYRRLVEQMQEGAATLSRDGTILYANRSLADLVGLPLERMIGRAMAAFVSLADVAAFMASLAEAADGASKREVVLAAADGRRVPVLLLMTLLAVADLPCLSLVATDLTQEKRALQELAAANERLRAESEERERVAEALHQRQKIETLGQLTGGVAHDFNNLLTAIVGNLDLLERHLPADLTAAHQLLHGAIRGAERGARLTEQLLAFSRKQHLVVKPADINSIVAGIDDLLERSVGGTVRVERALAPDLWLAAVDPTQIELILLNLAINARDAMPLGGTLTVETANLPDGQFERPTELAPGDYVLLAVADTGTGMSAEVLARVFEPFFTTKEPGKGTGLGLSQVHGTVRQLGGAVRIESGPNEGTIIRIYLPRAKSATIKAPVELPWTPADGIGTARAAAATVLVADDDPDVREFAVASLRGLGCTVLEAENGRIAVEMLARDEAEAPRIDLLVADFAMPGMNGVDVIRAARERRPDLRVLLMTGYIDDSILGPDLHDVPMLRKPFKLADMAEAVDELLRGGREAGGPEHGATRNAVSLRTPPHGSLGCHSEPTSSDTRERQ